MYYADLVEKLTEKVIEWFYNASPEWKQLIISEELFAVNAVNEICLDYLEDNYLHMGTAKRLELVGKVKKNFLSFLGFSQ